MIAQTCDISELTAKSSANAVEGKALCLFAAYGADKDFCRFYRQDKALIIAVLDNDYVICSIGGKPDYDELAAFICANGFNSLFTTAEICAELDGKFPADFCRNALMEYHGEYIPNKKTIKNPPLDEVYRVLNAAFDIPYEPWLLDTSHRVRHGVSELYLLDSASSCTVLYDLGGTAFITQVATLPSERGKGTARRLLHDVAGRYKQNGRRVQLVCRESLREFYEKCGFIRAGTVCQISAK